jgi:Domain of unknown function (DUF4380)
MTIQRIVYRGWQDCLLLSNSTVEAIIVPAVGRVMQFRFTGEDTGPFWENEQLDGRIKNRPTADEWLNFGGDKTWPSPQSEWGKQTGREWPPPDTFDSVPYHATIEHEQVLLTSEVDPHYGIRAERRVMLAANAAQMQITTEFQKVEGSPVHIGVWIITQLREPGRVFALLPDPTRFANGYIQQMSPVPKDVQRDGRLLSLKRDPAQATKIGTEANSLLWMDDRLAIRIRAEDSCGEYPNGGSRTEIYTNADPLRYVELETEGPLSTLKIGDRVARTNTYTLFRRSSKDWESEARRIFEQD